MATETQQRRAAVVRYAVYAALGLGALLFAFPLVWMALTALKPIEQTMTLPPTWLPHAHHATVDGRVVEVVPLRRLTGVSWLLEYTEGARAGARTVVPAGHADASLPGVRLVREAAPGWWEVQERSATRQVARPLLLEVVPPGDLRVSVRPRWENFPVALRSMGGRSVEGAEGSIEERPFNPATDATFLTFLLNTVLVCTLGVAGTVLSNAIIAYGFARLKWRGREAFFAITLSTMMIPFPVLMVPLYGIFRDLGWIGTLLPLWVPAFFGSAFNIFLMRQFFRTIPEELSEAARIDGASEWRIFWTIILPLSRPVLAVAALFHFLHAWNDFLGPLLYLTERPTFTLALALQNFQTQHGGVQWHHLMAASLVTVLPIIVLFFFAQKTFIQGIATTGTKG
jgi:multiple sugar transport system permease protein